MASVRKFKKEVSYLVNEVISDCYVALYFQPETSREAILGVITDAVELNNSLLDRINHPAEKHNAKLLRKHYQQLRNEMFDKIDASFDKLSQACAKPAPKKAAKAEAAPAEA